MAYRIGNALHCSRVSRSGHHGADVALALALAMSAILGGCATDESWPSVAKVSDITSGMTPEQRQKAVQDLQKGDTSQSGTAAASPPKSGQ